MACVVVFCTTYALILPAITLEKGTYCGKEEHAHVATCYTQVTSVPKTVPACPLEVHAHTEDCYDEAEKLICGQADFVVHQHDDRCYDENGDLWCPLPEIEAHTHDAACYTTPETHVHGESCYTMERGALLCTQSTAPVHVHTEDCYTEKAVLLCGQEEGEAHHHEESCYGTEPELTCGLTGEPAHTHVDTCYEWSKTLTCTLSTEPAKPKLTCDKPEIVLHEHTGEDCYALDEEGNLRLTCPETVVLEHVHTEACFQTVEEPVDTEALTCGQEEGESHTHTPLCHGTWFLTCGKEEHTHTQACWEKKEYTWSQDGLEITASFGPDATLPEHAALVVERLTPDAPMPLAQIQEMTAVSPTADEPDEPTVGNLSCRSSQTDEPGAVNDTPQEDAAKEQASLFPTKTEPDHPLVGNGLARSSSTDEPGAANDTPREDAAKEQASLFPTKTEPDEPTVGNGLARSSSTDEPGAVNDTPQEDASKEQASLFPTEQDTCIDYFRVYLAVDGAEVDLQAPADVTVTLQADQYPEDADIELIQLTEDGEQTAKAKPDAAGNLTANFTGALAGDYAVMALADAPRATGTEAAVSLTPQKRIDAFRDGVDNPDTEVDNNAAEEVKTDLYRLYLDAVVGPSTQNTAMNMLLVVDRSDSMNNAMVAGTWGDSRDEILNEILNGDEVWSGYRGNGLVNDFLSSNPENRIAVVGFAGRTNYPDGSQDASILQSWTNGIKTVNLGSRYGATNYCAGFMTADEVLSAVPNNNPTILVFLSDGRPTLYMDENGRDGPKNENDPVKVTECIEKSKPYFAEYIRKRHPNVTVYTVGMSSDIVGEGKDAILQYMAQMGGGQYVGATNASALKQAIQSAWADKTFTSFKMEDTLSGYVEFYEEPDIKVIKTAADGTTKTVLWENGAATAEGTNIVQSVVGGDGSGKTITAAFNPAYELEPGCTYSLSYNVKVNTRAYDDFSNCNYQDVGDADTDYDGNTTSSNRFGIYSNEKASVSYNLDNTQISRDLPHPVVQVGRSNVTGQPEINVTTHKTIDAFRDGEDNPDTALDDDLTDEDKADLYRLYLDAELTPQIQPIDLLIVVDQSGSMHQNYGWNANYTELIVLPDSDPAVIKDMYDGTEKIFRDEALRMVLNGTYSRDANDIAAEKEKGLVYQFLKANPNNKLAVVGFQGGGENRVYDIDANDDAETILGWTQGTGSNLYVDTEGIMANTTNYCAGFLAAGRMLEQVKDDGNKKVMLFMSDGIPTTHIEKQADGTYRREGDGSQTLTATDNATNQYFKDLIGTPNDPDNPNKDLLIHTVSIRADKTAERLQAMATQDVGHCYSISTTEELQRALAKVMYGSAYVDLAIEDQLSGYVDLYTDQPDYKVTMEVNGTEKVLYGNGAITQDGQDILLGVNYDETARVVTATFKPTYIPAPGTKVTLSFNVITDQKAYTDYKNNGNDYGTTVGDPDTDFAYTKTENGEEIPVRNDTSSEKPGFYSNVAYDPQNGSGTKLSYKRYNEATVTNKPYPQPVIQVSANGEPTKPENVGLKFGRSKTIDAFRDGADNPDTTLDNTAADKTDLYRLYLDATVTGEGNGIDLLIVVDESDSMTTAMDGMTREAVIRKILNGTAYESGYNANSMKDGLIYQFLSMNDKNKLAIVGFYGSRSFTNAYSDAADINGGWKSGVSNVSFVNVETPAGGPQGMQRTNYCAGLKVASDMLKDSEVKDDGNKKIMIFLSDGVPTYYIDWQTGQRRGTGTPADIYPAYNQTACKNGTIDYFDQKFIIDHGDVAINTVGIFSGTDGEYSTSKEVLTHMLRNGGEYITAGNTDTLQKAMLNFALQTDVTNLQIVDELSEYVKVHAQPDYKLTMVENGKTTVLYENGAVQAAGAGIVESVGCVEVTDSTTGEVTQKVVAKFVPSFKPRLGCKFSLSFNVETTAKAYEEFAKNGYTVKGDKDTDYSGNKTSSNQGGFHSNTQAYVEYDREAEHRKDTYRHPVVQAVTCKIVIHKTDNGDEPKPLPGAKFDLYRKLPDGEAGETLDGLPGAYVKVPQPDNPDGSRPATDEEGLLVFDNLVPGDYVIVETKAPIGYHKIKPFAITLSRSTSGENQIVGRTETVTIGDETLPSITVPNKPWGHELPSTGGTGTMPYTVAGVMILCFALVLWDKAKKETGTARR